MKVSTHSFFPLYLSQCLPGFFPLCSLMAYPFLCIRKVSTARIEFVCLESPTLIQISSRLATLLISLPFPSLWTNTISPPNPCQINLVNVQHGMNNGYLSVWNTSTEELMGGGCTVRPWSCVTLDLLCGQRSWIKELLVHGKGEVTVLSEWHCLL